MPSPEEHRQALGRAVRERRTELGWSLNAAAREWGVRAAWLSRLERGEANPQLNRLTALASAMDLSLPTLLRRAEALATRD